MKKTYWLCLLWLVSLLAGCVATKTPPPPPAVTITPVVGFGAVEDLMWANREDALLVSFYLTSNGVDIIPVAGTAYIQISRYRDEASCETYALGATHGLPVKDFPLDRSWCLLFDVETEVQAADFVLDNRPYVDVSNPREWRSEWRYWATIVVPHDAALEEFEQESVRIRVWFVPQGRDYTDHIWWFGSVFRDGHLKELTPFEPARE